MHVVFYTSDKMTETGVNGQTVAELATYHVQENYFWTSWWACVPAILLTT